MSNQIIDGKKVRSKKTEESQPVRESLEGIFGNALDVPAFLKKELDTKGLEGRWIDYKNYVENAGFHRTGWAPYKPENGVGTTPDGYIRRGSVVLAARSKEQSDRHRAILKGKADRQLGAAKSSTQANELRRMSNNTVPVVDGYED